MKYIGEKETWKKGGIYKISSIIDERFYIGSTNNFRERFRSHRNKLKRGVNPSQHLQRFCSKYGLETLIFEVIEIVENNNLLIEREDFYILLLKPKFNLMPTAVRQHGQKHTEKTKKLMRKKAREAFDNGRSSWNKGKFIFNQEQVIEIRQRIKNGEKQIHLAKEYNVTLSTINRLYKKQYNGI